MQYLVSYILCGNPTKSDFIQFSLLYHFHKTIRTLLDALLTFGYNVPVATFLQTRSTKP